MSCHSAGPVPRAVMLHPERQPRPGREECPAHPRLVFVRAAWPCQAPRRQCCHVACEPACVISIGCSDHATARTWRLAAGQHHADVERPVGAGRGGQRPPCSLQRHVRHARELWEGVRDPRVRRLRGLPVDCLEGAWGMSTTQHGGGWEWQQSSEQHQLQVVLM